MRLSELASFLGTTVDDLITEKDGPLGGPPPGPPMSIRGDRPDLAVYASAAGGPEGAWVLSGEAIAWIQRDQKLQGVRDAFACYVVGESMFPAYEQGNLLLVNPAVPPNAGDDCLLIQEARRRRALCADQAPGPLQFDVVDRQAVEPRQDLLPAAQGMAARAAGDRQVQQGVNGARQSVASAAALRRGWG